MSILDPLNEFPFSISYNAVSFSLKFNMINDVYKLTSPYPISEISDIDGIIPIFYNPLIIF